MAKSALSGVGQCIDLGLGSVLNRPHSSFTAGKEREMAAENVKINVPCSLPYRVVVG